MQNTYLPVYVMQKGYGTVIAGLLTTVFTLSALVFRSIAGYVLDSKGRYIVLLVGTVIFGIASGLYLFAIPVAALLILRGLNGIGFCWSGTALSTMASDVLPDSRMSEGIGYMGLAYTVAQAIAPAVILFVADRMGSRSAFGAIFLLAAAAIGVSLLLKNTRRPGAESEEKNTERSAAQEKLPFIYRIFERKAWKPAFLVLLVSISTSSVFTFVATYETQRGIAGVGAFFTVAAVTMAISRLTVGKISERYGSACVLLPNFILLGISFLGIAYCNNLSALLFSAVLYGFSLGAVQPEINALAVLAADREYRGAANATYLLMMDIGNGFGSAMWGLIAASCGMQWVFIFGGALMLPTFAMYFILRKYIPKKA
jgi:MFS family permease